MSYDEYWTDYYLTENGWVKGVSSYDSNQDAPPPEGTLLTMRRNVYQSSGWSAEDVSWAETWKSDNLSDEKRSELLAKFGNEPGGKGMPATPKRKKRKIEL